MFKGIIFFLIIFILIFLIWKYFDVINNVFKIGTIFKYLIIILAVLGMIFPRFYSDVDKISTQIGFYNFLAKKKKKNFI